MAQKLKLAIALEMIDKVSAPAKKIKGINGHVQASIKKVENQQRKLAQYQGLNSKLKEESAKLSKSQAEFKRLQHEIKNTAKPTKALSNKLVSAAKRVNRLSVAQKALRKKLGDTRRELKGQGVDTRNLIKAQDALAKKTRMLSRLKSGSQLAGQVGKKAKLGAAIGLGALSTGSALLLSQLKQSANEADKIAKLSNNLKFDSFNLQALRYQGELSGVAEEDIDNAMTRFSKRMGRLKQGGGALSGILNKTDEKFANTLSNVGSNDEALTLMTDYIAGIKDAQQQSALADAAFGQTGRNMLVMLREGKEGINASREEFKRFGGGVDVSFQSSAEKFNDTLLRISAITKAIKFKVLAPVLELVTGKIQGFLNKFSDGDQAQQTINMLVSQIKRFIRVLKDVFIAIKEMYSIISGIKDFVGGWKNFAIIMTTFKLMPLITGFGSLITLLSTLAIRQKAVAAWNAIVTSSQWLWNAALSANPIGLVIAAVVGLVAAGVYLYKNWDTIIAFLSHAWQGFKEHFATIFPMINMFVEAAKIGANLIGGIWDSLFGDKDVKVNLPDIKKMQANIKTSDITAPPPRVRSTAPLGGNVSQQQNQNNPISITVNPSPGMDEKQLAGMVQQQLESAQREQQSSQRSNMYDYD